jgi:hypothetical protein
MLKSFTFDAAVLMLFSRFETLLIIPYDAFLVICTCILVPCCDRLLPVDVVWCVVDYSCKGFPDSQW